MLLSDGVAAICVIKDTSTQGMAPKQTLVPVERVYFGIKTAGVTRFYAAKQAGNRVDLLIETQRVNITASGFYVVIEDDQYRIVQVQNVVDSDGLPMTDLTLEKLEHCYDLS